MSRALRISHPVPSSLDEPALREMWRLRLRFMRHLPGVDPEDDYARFSKTVRAADDVLVTHDAAGRLVSMVTVRSQARAFEGRRFLWLYPEYGFVDPAHRGGVRVHLEFIRALRRASRRADLPVYVVSLGWPSGFLSYRLIADLRILGDPRASAWERRMVEELAAELGGDGWEPERRRVRMRVVPIAPLRTPRGPLRRRACAYYLTHNPAWSEGYAAVVYHRVPPAAITWLRVAGGVLLDRVGKRLIGARRADGATARQAQREG